MMKRDKAGLLLGGLLACLGLVVLIAAGCRALETAPEPEPLPRSTKGYELYSWPADSGGWHYLLVTGTNRLKSGDEVLSAVEEISEGGLVTLPVQGTEALKAALGRLPEGETVHWIGPGWLEAVGGAEGPFARPGPQMRMELEAFCRARGVELTVTE